MTSSHRQTGMTLLLLALITGCGRVTPGPSLNSRSESAVMTRFMSSKPGEVESPWQELEATLGPGETISFQEFLKVTRYKSKEPSQVECRIWRNDRGEWLAVAYEPEAKSLSGIKSYMRR